MKNEKKQITSLTSRSFRDARKAPPRGVGATSPKNSSLLSPEEMEAANVRALNSRGRMAHSLRAIARRRDDLGQNAPTRKKEALRPTIDASRLRSLAQDWFRECRMNGFSPRTLGAREWCLERFFWFIERERFTCVGRLEIEAYLLHVRTGHEEPEGRFGTRATNPRALEAVRPATYRNHFNALAAFFSFQTKKGLWEKSPFDGIGRAKVPVDTDVLPISAPEIEALLTMAKKGAAPHRDYAIIRFLVDTGVRASELCAITFGDVDEKTNAVTIMGKGSKKRIVYFGDKTARALWKHISDVGAIWGEDARKPHAPLFASERGTRAGQNFQPRALLALIERIGARTGTSHVHPHRFRHTFAINFLKNGGNQISLMRLLGHTDLTMTRHYVQFADADLEEQHRKFSPGDRMRG